MDGGMGLKGGRLGCYFGSAGKDDGRGYSERGFAGEGMEERGECQEVSTTPDIQSKRNYIRSFGEYGFCCSFQWKAGSEFKNGTMHGIAETGLESGGQTGRGEGKCAAAGMEIYKENAHGGSLSC